MRTSYRAVRVSQACQKAKFLTLFNQLIGARQQRRRHSRGMLSRWSRTSKADCHHRASSGGAQAGYEQHSGY
jgi:hypothetical protein